MTEFGISRAAADKDLHVQILNPMEADHPTGIRLAVFVAIVSALKSTSVPAGHVIPGDMSIQGSILPPDAVGEMVLLARENGARTVLVPAANQDDIGELPRLLLDGLTFRYFNSPAELVSSVLTQ